MRGRGLLPELEQLSLLIGQLLLLHRQVLLEAPQLHLQSLVVGLEVGEGAVFGLRDGAKRKPINL